MMYIKPFNLVYFLILLIIAFVVILVTRLCHNLNLKHKKLIILSFCLFNIIYYIVYKFNLAFNVPYLNRKGYHFIIWNELPLHLCNISLFLVPLGVILNNKRMLGYGFYIAPFGAILALTFPDINFINISILKFAVGAFYFTHAIIIINGILLVTLGLYKPRFKEIPFLILFAIGLSFIIFIINIIIRYFTHFHANYFYTMHPNHIPILEFLFRIVPVPYLYICIVFVLFALVAYLITLPFEIYYKYHH